MTYPKPPEFVAQGDRVLVGVAIGKIKATDKTFKGQLDLRHLSSRWQAEEDSGVHRYASVGKVRSSRRMKFVAFVARNLLETCSSYSAWTIFYNSPTAIADKFVGVALPRRDLQDLLFNFFSRGASMSWFAFALQSPRAAATCPTGCRDLQHLCVPSHDSASNHLNWPPRRRPLGSVFLQYKRSSLRSL